MSSKSKRDDLTFAKEFESLVRRKPILETLKHPAVTDSVSEEFEQIYKSTLQVKAEDRIGSGFWVAWAESRYIVTNAHVIGNCSECTVQIRDRLFIERYQVSVAAIDHVHDVAILVPQPTEEAHQGDDEDSSPATLSATHSLNIGESPRPGDSVAICGYPLACNGRRLLRGLVSGYEVLTIENIDNVSVVIQAPVNQGNSGGPVCNSEGEVCGVIWAIARRVRNANVTSDELDTLDVIERAITPTDGFGFALDPIWIKSMLRTFDYIHHQTQSKLIEKYAPKEIEFSREDFVELQRQCVSNAAPDSMSTIGVFHYSPETESISLGWRGKEQLTLNVPDAWINLAKDICANGGHFVLHGYHLRLYRQRYHGWIVPRILKLI